MNQEIKTHIAKINNLEAGTAILFPDGNMNVFLKLGKQIVQVKIYKIKKYGKETKIAGAKQSNAPTFSKTCRRS
jgi:hypothetical protein